MTCSSTFLKYPLTVWAQTPAAYILMYCNVFSTTFTAVRCFQLRKNVLRLILDGTWSYQSSDRTFMTKMSTSGSSAKNSHLTLEGRTTMMLMPVNRVTSQYKIKLSQKYCPWINLQLLKLCHSFLQWMGSFFLISMFCSAIHVYTDRFADIGIIVIRPPWLRCEFLAELPLVLIFWSSTKVLDSSIWASIQGDLQSQYLFPELEATYCRKSRWTNDRATLSWSAKQEVTGMANFEIKDDYEGNILNSTHTAAYS